MTSSTPLMPSAAVDSGAPPPALKPVEVSVSAVHIPVWVPATGGAGAVAGVGADAVAGVGVGTHASSYAPAHMAQLVGNVYRPAARADAAETGSLGLIVLSHGTPGDAEKRADMVDSYGPQAKALARLGFVVVTALRRGYGASDGPQADRYGNCDAPDYEHAAQEAARDVAAVLEFGRKLPQVDASRIVLLGKSAGGFASLALASQRPPGVRAVVNFSGGRGSQPQQRALGQVCGEAQMLQTLSGFAAASPVPQLWIYAENDHYFAPPLVRKMAAVYEQANVPLQLQWMPPSGKEGHRFFDLPGNIPQWLPLVRNFLQPWATARAPSAS